MVMTSFHTWCLLSNSSEDLDIAGGRRRFFYRQLSSCRVITMLAAGWAEAWSCQALTAAIHMAGKIFISQDTDFAYNVVDAPVETAGPGVGVPTIGAELTQKGLCARANRRQCHPHPQNLFSSCSADPAKVVGSFQGLRDMALTPSSMTVF